MGEGATGRFTPIGPAAADPGSQVPVSRMAVILPSTLAKEVICPGIPGLRTPDKSNMDSNGKAAVWISKRA